MIVYQSDGTVRATIEVSEDAELLLQVSDECSFTTKITAEIERLKQERDKETAAS